MFLIKEFYSTQLKKNINIVQKSQHNVLNNFYE